MKRLYTFLVAVIDVILLVVIVKAAAAEKSDNSGISAAESSRARPAASSVSEQTAPATTAGSVSQPDSVLPAAADYSTDEFAEYADMSGAFLDGTNGFLWTDLLR